jgi:hypothetical protein
VSFKKPRLRCDARGCHNRGVESFQVSDLQHRAALPSRLDDYVCLFNRASYRFFDKYRYPGFEKIAGDWGVRLSRHRHTRSLDVADEFAIISDEVCAVAVSNLTTARFVDIADDCNV